MKILVVDDEALLVKGIRFNLQNEGYEVITGSDGLEAVQAVQSQHPDLVVLDVMMPNMDGLSACAAFGRKKWASAACAAPLKSAPVSRSSPRRGHPQDTSCRRTPCGSASTCRL